MKIKVLGTRGEIEPTSPYHSKKSGVLIDNKILFDIGEEDFLKENPHYIFITHLIITEASYYCKGGIIRRDEATGKLYGHAGVPDLLRLFSKFTKHILFAHFAVGFMKTFMKLKKN